MIKNKLYTLPELPYAYNDLEPYISEEQIRTHHDKHHASYVNNANKLLEKLAKSREDNTDLDMKAVLKELSFNIGGHVLHSLFWTNMTPPKNGGGGEPPSDLLKAIEEEFGSFERFKKEFIESTMFIEGSGWTVLAYDRELERILLMQIEKHNLNIYPTFDILMVFDFWEHAYYIDHKNEKSKFIEAFWNVVCWNRVNKRLDNIKKSS